MESVAGRSFLVRVDGDIFEIVVPKGKGPGSILEFMPENAEVKSTSSTFDNGELHRILAFSRRNPVLDKRYFRIKSLPMLKWRAGCISEG